MRGMEDRLGWNHISKKENHLPNLCLIKTEKKGEKRDEMNFPRKEKERMEKIHPVFRNVIPD